MRKLAIFLVFALLLTGCNRPQPMNDEEIIATLAAATLTARPAEDKLPPQQGTAVVETQPLPTNENQDPLSPTETTAPTDTAAPSETPSLTPTETGTPTTTITLTPTLVEGDPVASLGTPTFKDNFANANNFYTYNEDSSKFEIKDGVFLVKAKKANSYETWSLSWAELKNFYLEATGTFGEECGGKDRYGLIFRAPDTDQGYLLSITCDGSYRLSSYDGEDYKVIKGFTKSEYIQSGPGGTNRLGIRAKDSKLKVYINGHEVLSKENTQFKKGRFGVLVAASDTAGFTATLSEVVYWKLD